VAGRQAAVEEREGGAGAVSSAGHAVRFSSWCPKVIAAIGHLHPTLASRCIVIRMQRKAPGEECERLKRLEATEFKRKCAWFVADHAEAIARAEPEIPRGLANRAADVWEPLLVLADLAGGAWPNLAREAALGLTARAQEHSPIGSLLMDILAEVHGGEDGAGVQPRPAGSARGMRGVAVVGAEKGQEVDGGLAGAAVTALRREAENDPDWGTSGAGLCGGGDDGNVPAVYSEIGGGGSEGGIGRKGGEKEAGEAKPRGRGAERGGCFSYNENQAIDKGNDKRFMESRRRFCLD
jgi:hypothetical protein